MFIDAMFLFPVYPIPFTIRTMNGVSPNSFRLYQIEV
jgi:hypothetical protein